MKTTTILLVGVGGQGTILAGNLLAMTAAEAGLDVKVSEIHGMSQRGGSVSTVIRVGEHVDSMVCDPGCADVIVAFEAVEGEINDRIDDAYRAKYGRSSYLASMISPRAREATVRIEPKPLRG